MTEEIIDDLAEVYSRVILVIAPADSNLPDIDTEIAAIKRYHPESTIVQGEVRESDILEAIGRKQYEMIWFIFHSGEEGGQLSNDASISNDTIGQYVVASGATLCFMNSCASETIARRIVHGGLCDMVYTIQTLDNRDAIRFGTLFAAALAQTPSNFEAFDKAQPARGGYRFLEASQEFRAMALTTSSLLHTTIAEVKKIDMLVSSELPKLSERVAEAVKITYQLVVDVKADRILVGKLEAVVLLIQQQLETLRQQALAQSIRDDVRKELQSTAMAAMGHRIDTNQNNPATPAPTLALVPAAGRPSPTVMLLVLIAVLLIVGVIILGRMYL